MITKPWPGRTHTTCPECEAPDSVPWDMEYETAKIGVSMFANQKLISMTCPACQTKFIVTDGQEVDSSKR